MIATSTNPRAVASGNKTKGKRISTAQGGFENNGCSYIERPSKTPRAAGSKVAYQSALGTNEPIQAAVVTKTIAAAYNQMRFNFSVPSFLRASGRHRRSARTVILQSRRRTPLAGCFLVLAISLIRN